MPPLTTGLQKDVVSAQPLTPVGLVSWWIPLRGWALGKGYLVEAVKGK